MKYTADEARLLKGYGEIPDNGMFFLHYVIFIVNIETTDVVDAVEEDNSVFVFDQI